MPGDFGTGAGHLYEQLKRLALIEPDLTSGKDLVEPRQQLLRILNESPDSHYFLVTANRSAWRAVESVQTLKIIEF